MMIVDKMRSKHGQNRTSEYVRRFAGNDDYTGTANPSKNAQNERFFVLTFENGDAQCNFDLYVQKHTYGFFGEITKKLVVSPPYYGTQINRCGTYKFS